MSIRFKDGGVSSYKPLYALTPKAGDSFLSKDGLILVFILRSSYIVWVRTDDEENQVFTHGVISDFTGVQEFKAVDVELTLKAL